MCFFFNLWYLKRYISDKVSDVINILKILDEIDLTDLNKPNVSNVKRCNQIDGHVIVG